MMLHSRETPLSQADTSKKKSPGVPRQSGDARLSDLEAELEQLAMNARRSPQGIFRADPPDQRAQFRGCPARALGLETRARSCLMDMGRTQNAGLAALVQKCPVCWRASQNKTANTYFRALLGAVWRRWRVYWWPVH
jgi:hypothetical protein